MFRSLRPSWYIPILIAFFCLFWMCGPVSAQVWMPAPRTTIQVQFVGNLDLEVDADVYDLDLFDTPSDVVSELHRQGRHAICYFSAGTWEEWRPDSDSFPSEVLGKVTDHWDRERWLDIRRIDLLLPIMVRRLDLCKAKGFDAVDPDNIDGYQNDTNFNITREDQIRYNRQLALEAHKRGMSIGLKNATELAPRLVRWFDWALTEECFVQGWCGNLSPFLRAGKVAFDIEYTDTPVRFRRVCSRAADLGLTVILKDRDLDAWRKTCP